MFHQAVGLWVCSNVGQCGSPIVCLGHADRGASQPQPAIEHSRCDAHVHILYVCLCVIRVVVLSASDIGSIITRPRA